MQDSGLAVVGTLINAMLSVAVFASGEYPAEISFILFGCVGVSVIGLILAAAGQNKLGAGLVIAGGIAFVPIGLIAAMGGRKMLDAANLRAFQAEEL